MTLSHCLLILLALCLLFFLNDFECISRMQVKTSAQPIVLSVPICHCDGQLLYFPLYYYFLTNSMFDSAIILQLVLLMMCSVTVFLFLLSLIILQILNRIKQLEDR